jgi:predicted transcriptional regulator
MSYTITAYDIVNNTMLWNYTLPISTMHTVTLDKDNVKDILGEYTAYYIPIQATQQQSPGKIMSMPELYIYSSNDLVLVNARSINYEAPVVLGQSKCVYSSEIYAFSPTGSLLYDRPLDQFAAAAVANNSTIIFGMRGGEIAAVSIVTVTGIALLTALALGLKFLLAGTITRARSRVDKNENRNLVLEYIREHPGSTLYEISRGMEMNMGTVRYHVFILSTNHRIATFNDGKFVRYFPNSNFYSKEEQLVVSLMRREPIKQVIRILETKPGLSNTELAKEVDQADSTMSKLMKELCGKGITTKIDSADGSSRYMINEGYKPVLNSVSNKLTSIDNKLL